MRTLTTTEQQFIAGGTQVLVNQPSEEVVVIKKPSFNELLLREIFYVGFHVLIDALISGFDDDDDWQTPCYDPYYC